MQAVVGGASAFGAGVHSFGIPKDSVLRYDSALKASKFLFMAHGTANEASKAKDILHTTNPAEVNFHAGRSEAKAE